VATLSDIIGEAGGKMPRETVPFATTFYLLLFPLLGGMIQTPSAKPPTDTQPLKTTLRVIGQKFCQEDKGYSIVQNLDVHIVNQTNGKLIVEEEANRYEITVASDLENLSRGKYEYHPHIMWGDVYHSEEPQAKSPGSDFLILAPGESFERVADFWASIRRADLPPLTGILQPGNHLLQLTISTWDYRTNPEEFRKPWEQIGTLVATGIKTEPLTIFLPPDPKFDKCN